MAVKTVKYTQKQYERNLQSKKGYKFLSSGCYANVYEHSDQPDRVTKVACCTSTFARDGYLAWVREIQTNLKDNPHTPTIYSLQLVRTKKQNSTRYDYWYVIVLEKLMNFHDAEGYSARIKKLGLVEGYESLGMKRTQTNGWSSILLAVHNTIKTLVNEDHDHDIHSGNIMWRGRNMTLVVTDPVA